MVEDARSWKSWTETTHRGYPGREHAKKMMKKAAEIPATTIDI